MEEKENVQEGQEEERGVTNNQNKQAYKRKKEKQKDIQQVDHLIKLTRRN